MHDTGYRMHLGERAFCRLVRKTFKRGVEMKKKSLKRIVEEAEKEVELVFIRRKSIESGVYRKV